MFVDCPPEEIFTSVEPFSGSTSRRGPSWSRLSGSYLLCSWACSVCVFGRRRWFKPCPRYQEKPWAPYIPGVSSCPPTIGYPRRERAQTPSTHTRTCNKLPGVHMCTSQVALMDMDRGILARIDRKLLAGLCDDEALRTLRVPATGATWSTWKRYCDAAGVSMGRAVAMLMDRELLSVFGEHTAGEWPVLAQQAVEELASREARIESREHKVDTDEARIREGSEGLRRWEDELETREQQAEFASRIALLHSTDHAKIGRNERCPCGSGLKYKRCHGVAGRHTQPAMGGGLVLGVGVAGCAAGFLHTVPSGSVGSTG